MQGFKSILSLEVELDFLDKISRDTKLVKQQILILPDGDGEDYVGYNDDHGDVGDDDAEAGDPCAMKPLGDRRCCQHPQAHLQLDDPHLIRFLSSSIGTGAK